MRDPELVFKAQLAASALERAWQHWRVIHGLLADPMPATSSYVGYSLEEPWGQPRVVFGLAAADAEHLAALLERHDFVDPVHAMTANQLGSRELIAGADAITGRPLPVPPQAPSLHAEQMFLGDGPSGRAKFGPAADEADDQDGPVYRQLAAALRAVTDAGALRETREPEAAGQEPAAQEPAGLQEPEGQEPAGPQEPEGLLEPDGQEPAGLQEPEEQEPEGHEPEGLQLVGPDQAGPEPAASGSAARESAAREPALTQQARDELVGQEPARQDAAGRAGGETGEAAAVHDQSDVRGGTGGSGSDGDGNRRSDVAADIEGAHSDSRTSGKSRNSRTGDRGGLNREPGKNDSGAADRRASARRAGSRRDDEGRSTHNGSAASHAGAPHGSDAVSGAAPDAGQDAATPATPLTPATALTPATPLTPATSAAPDAVAGGAAGHSSIAHAAAPVAPVDLGDEVANEAMPGYEDPDADSDAAGQGAPGPGPLALAASAAKAAAEARIRAVAQKAGSTALKRPYQRERGEVTDPAGLPADVGTVSAADGDQGSAASGDSPEVAGPSASDVAAAWGGPALTARGQDEPEVVRFWPWSESAAYGDGDPEPGRSAVEAQDDPEAGYARRSRISRSSIPRLSRAKRPGPVPGS